MKQDIITNLKNLFFSLLALVVVFVFLVYFGGKGFIETNKFTRSQETENPYKDISPETFNAMLQLKSANNFFLLSAQDQKDEHIVGTDIFISYANIVSKQNLLPAEKNKMIVVYSKDGKLGKVVAQKLALMGYKNVFNLKGGTNAFKDRGFSLSGSNLNDARN